VNIRQLMVGPACTAVASGIDPFQWFTLRLEVRTPGPLQSVRGYVNGVLKIDCNLQGGSLNGQSGVVTYGTGTVARFDDIRVSVP
jgi:hypothetical protein